MEPDQHSGPEQGTGHGPDPGASGPHEEPVTREASPEGDVIMSKLPRTRPQRVTERRHREQARQARQVARSSSDAPDAPKESAQAPRAKRATSQRRAAARPKSRANTPAASRPARRRPPAAVPVTQASKASEPARRRAETGNAPGLPRLALDGAVEAAKLPLKVGGRLTLRALDAAARSLRGR